MKMRNDDLKKITEIKQYLLDPPISFKLYDYALNYLNDAISVLKDYPVAKDIVDYLQNIFLDIENKNLSQEELRKVLKDTGIKISTLTNK
jgi:hypothetical protein